MTDLFAYCLLRNHFHLCVRVKSLEEILRPQPLFPNRKEPATFAPGARLYTEEGHAILLFVVALRPGTAHSGPHPLIVQFYKGRGGSEIIQLPVSKSRKAVRGPRARAYWRTYIPVMKL